MARLGDIIRLLMQLRLGLAQYRAEIRVAWDDARHAQEGRQIVDVAVDAGAHAGVLHLDRQIAAVMRLRAVHLPDRGGGEGAQIKAFEAPIPSAAPGGIEHRLQLLGRHMRRLGAQGGHDRGHLGRQDKARIHREHLPQFHRRPAHLAQITGYAPRGGGGQQQTGQVRTLALGHLAQATGEHVAHDARGHPAQAQHAAKAVAGHGGGSGLVCRIAHAACLCCVLVRGKMGRACAIASLRPWSRARGESRSA